MENQEVTPCLLLDLSAAFDTVDHDLFISMRERFGITDNALNWFEQYRRPRSFCVKINNTSSSEKILTFSVPQGSAAGANFFIAYCKALPFAIPTGVELQVFADDHFTHTKFKASDRVAENLAISRLTTTFNNIQTWMQGMRLKFNSDKTEFIIFGNQAQLNKPTTKSITLSEDTVISTADSVKCLGT